MYNNNNNNDTDNDYTNNNVKKPPYTEPGITGNWRTDGYKLDGPLGVPFSRTGNG